METNIRFMTETGEKLKCTAPEIKRFLGISILMGTIKYPRIKKYWQQGFRIPIISDTMARNRFFLLRSFLRAKSGANLSDAEKEADRLWRVRPILAKFRECCLQVPRTTNLSVDEMMIPFQGRMPARQYLSMKPHPFGMKVFVLANPNGVILDFQVYIGQGTFSHLAYEITNMVIGASAVISLLDNVPAGSFLYFDRYFTSEALLDYLLEKRIAATGTVIRTRIPRHIHFKEDSVMKNEGRRASQTYERKDKKMSGTKWLENKPVFLLSTIHSAKPGDVVQRWSKKDHNHINVNRPTVIKHYNESMGGVDLANRMVSLYRMGYRTNKWPVRIIQHFLDCALSNAWIIYRENAPKSRTPNKDIMDFLDFRHRIGKCWIREIQEPEDVPDDGYEDDQPATKKRKVVQHPSNEVRKDKAAHLAEFVSSSQSNRCRHKGCKGHTRIRCTECKLFLCVAGNRNCFLEYHKE